MGFHFPKKFQKNQDLAHECNVQACFAVKDHKPMLMKRLLPIVIASAVLAGCEKNTGSNEPPANCDITATLARNTTRIQIVTGVHGTISSMEGNCMPVVLPGSNTCTHCPVSRTLKIHAYTRTQDAVAAAGKPGFYQQVRTTLVREITPDADGFYQAELPPGQYSILILEDGLLHAPFTDSNGGLNPVTVSTGRQKLDLVMKYKATF